jgi:hypothetical protein
MAHLGDVVFRHVCTHKAHIRARRGYEPTRKAAMAAFAKRWRGVKGVDRPAGGSIQNNSDQPIGLARGSMAG